MLNLGEARVAVAAGWCVEEEESAEVEVRVHVARVEKECLLEGRTCLRDLALSLTKQPIAEHDTSLERQGVKRCVCV